MCIRDSYEVRWEKKAPKVSGKRRTEKSFTEKNPPYENLDLPWAKKNSELIKTISVPILV